MRELTIVGPGQIGQLLGRGALCAGMRVTPVRRGEGRPRYASIEPGTPIVVAVGERDLQAALAEVPDDLRDDVVLVQNELFPSRWRALGLREPTVLVLWSNKKAHRPLEPGRRSGVYGRHADAMADVHEALGLGCTVLETADALGLELVSKYAFILAINVLGLIENKTAGDWLADDPERVEAVVDEAIALGAVQLGEAVDVERVRWAVIDAMRSLAQMPSRGRSAPARLARALELAREHGVELSALVTAGSLTTG